MKIFITILLLLSILSCKAQHPLHNADPELPSGTYYKDLNNDLDKFEGTWKWEDNNSSFTIVLQKIEHDYDGEYYRDVLIGEYEYIENGELLINTLTLLNDTTIEAINRNIYGCRILNKFHPLKCDDCSLDERRVQLDFSNPDNSYWGVDLWLRHRVINNVEQLDAKLLGYRDDEVVNNGNHVSNSSGRVPFGEYTLIKVE